jgi:hypothetical protein
MKLVVVLSLLCATSAFVVAPSRVSAIALKAARYNDRMRIDDWSDKPVPDKKSTKSFPTKVVTGWQRKKMDDVMIPPDFTLTWAVALLGPLIWWYHPCK